MLHNDKEPDGRKSRFHDLVTVLAVVVVVFVVNATFVTVREIASEVWAKDIPQGWATLIGAIIGLFAIALASFLGFRNLIHSQQHQSELDRQAMAQRANIEKEARQHQYEIDQKKELTARQEETKFLAATLRGELITVTSRFFDVVDTLRTVYSVIEKKVEKGEAFDQLNFPRLNTPAFDANVTRLGLLGVSLASDVAYLFPTLQLGIKISRYEVLAEKKIALAMVKGVVDSASRIDEASTLLIRRLRQIEVGREDPGPPLQIPELSKFRN